MRTQTTEARLAIGKANANRDTLFGRWLEDNGWTATSWAEAHPVIDPKTGQVEEDRAGQPILRWAPSSVRAWQLDPKVAPRSARAIPEEAAQLIEVESDKAVPATDDSWPSGISRPRRRRA